MNIFYCCCVLFVVGACGGWVLELFYRRFVSSHKWINPGFLVGPCLPLYGFGVTFLFLISYVLHFDTWFNLPSYVNDIIVIVIMSITMTLVEYIAGIIFIKGMGIKLWDYSTRWGNIQGIICPLFSLIWSIIAIAFYYLFRQPCYYLISWFSDETASNVWFPFVLGMIYGIFVVDLCYSSQLTHRITKFAKEKHIVVKFEEFKMQVRLANDKAKEKIHFVLALSSSTPLKEHLENYINNVKEKINDIKNKDSNEK